MMRSTDECEMSRSCHSATFSSPADEVAPQHPGQPAELLGLHRVPLVRHRARALLRAGAERLLDLAHLGALEVADLRGERLDASRRATRTRRAARRGGRGRAPAWRAPAAARACSHTYASTAGSTLRVGADRARQLPDRDDVACAHEPPPLAAELQRPERELGAEGRGLGVDAVRPPDHRRVAVLTCAGPRSRRSSSSTASSSEVAARATSVSDERGVDDVARREPVVHPRRLGPPTRSCTTSTNAATSCSVTRSRASISATSNPARSRIAAAASGGTTPSVGPRLDREDLDLEPGGEAGLVGEQVGHRRERVPGDQVQAASVPTLYEARAGHGRPSAETGLGHVNGLAGVARGGPG